MNVPSPEPATAIPLHLFNHRERISIKFEWFERCNPSFDHVNGQNKRRK